MHFSSKSRLAKEQFYYLWLLRALRSLRHRRFTTLAEAIKVLLVNTALDSAELIYRMMFAIFVGPRLVRRQGPDQQNFEDLGDFAHKREAARRFWN